MAIVPIHRRITKEILKEFSFTEVACDIAADANAAIDEKQGSSHTEANLHAMLGFLPGGQMQSREAAQAAIRRVLDDAKSDIIAAINEPNYRHALQRLGEALHTVQDGEYHRYEPWPFNGITEAFLNSSLGQSYGLRPNYMLCHGLRDLSFISGFNYGARFRSDQGWSSHYWIELTLPSANPLTPHLSFGSYGSWGQENQRSEVAGYFNLTWGAIPGSTQHPSARPDNNQLAGNRENLFCPEVSQGPSSFQHAEKKSREFVQTIKTAVGNAWFGFVSYNPKSKFVISDVKDKPSQ